MSTLTGLAPGAFTYREPLIGSTVVVPIEPLWTGNVPLQLYFFLPHKYSGSSGTRGQRRTHEWRKKVKLQLPSL
jgi:hypothetical protein